MALQNNWRALGIEEPPWGFCLRSEKISDFLVFPEMDTMGELLELGGSFLVSGLVFNCERTENICLPTTQKTLT